MPKLKSEKHHWWPRCVSRLWKAEDGKVGRITPDGQIRRASPEQFGVIGNGHHIKLHKEPGQWTKFDHSFEKEFDDADGQFPKIIEWLGSLKHPASDPQFVEQQATDDQLLQLTESVVSLVARSPRNRESAVSLAESFRGSLPAQERNAIIGLNIRRSQRLIADAVGHSAKFAVFLSPHQEFIFGDGLFHNLVGVQNSPPLPKMLVPLTPTISVAIVRPMSYRNQPRFVTRILQPTDVVSCNHAIQVYSRSELFFRSEQSVLDEAFKAGRHLIYSSADNPIDIMLRSIPGVPERDRSLDFLQTL
jgi:hypothetical protein